LTVSALIGVLRARALDLTTRLDWVAPLVARITLGVLFASTGWGKVHDLEKVSGFFAELGIPMPHANAVLVSLVELLGGSLLLIGLGSRLATLPLMAAMTVAILTAQRENVHGLPDLFGLVEWTYLALLLGVALAGPGKASLDHWLLGKKRRAPLRTFPEPLPNH
jgi:putative oxidoreductase